MMYTLIKFKLVKTNKLHV